MSLIMWFACIAGVACVAILSKHTWTSIFAQRFEGQQVTVQDNSGEADEYVKAVMTNVSALRDEERHPEAIELLENAISACHGKAWLQQPLAYLLTSLGIYLADLGRLEDSEAVLRDAVSQEIHVFGAGSIEYCQTALEFAYILWANNKLNEAQEVLANAFSVANRLKDICAFEILASKCVVDSMLREVTPELQALSGIARYELDLDHLAEHFMNRLSLYPVELKLPALEILVEGAEKYIPVGATGFKAAGLIEAGMAAEHCGEFVRAEAYFTRCLNLATEDRNVHHVVWSLLHLADVCRATNDLSRAEQFALSACSKGQKVGSKVLMADALRGYAAVLVSCERIADAHKYFHESVTIAESTKSMACKLRAKIDLAIFLHHSGRYDDALEILAGVRKRLPSDSDDIERVDSHLQASTDSHSCGCFDDVNTDEVISHVAKTFREIDLVAEFLKGVVLSPTGKLDFLLEREITASEEELMDNYAQELMTEFYRRTQASNLARIRSYRLSLAG